jgi:hypothetical protein
MKKMEGTTDGHFFERLFVNEIRKTVLVGPFWKNKKTKNGALLCVLN